MRDGLTHHVGADEVLDRARLAAVGAEVEGVETSEMEGLGEEENVRSSRRT